MKADVECKSLPWPIAFEVAFSVVRPPGPEAKHKKRQPEVAKWRSEPAGT